MSELLAKVNFVDAVSLFVLLVFVMQGFRLGFMRIATGVLCLIGTVYLANLIALPAARWIFDRLGLRDTIYATLTDIFQQHGSGLYGQGLLDGLNKFVEQHTFLRPFIANALERNKDVVQAALGDGALRPELLITSIVNSVETVMLFGIRIVCFFVIAFSVYVVILVICNAVVKVLSLLPVIGTVDKLLGGLLGGVGGCFAVLVVVAVMFLIIGVSGGVGVLTSAELHSSFVYSIILRMQNEFINIL